MYYFVFYANGVLFSQVEILIMMKITTCSELSNTGEYILLIWGLSDEAPRKQAGWKCLG